MTAATLTVPPLSDMHVHLRTSHLMRLVAPLLAPGGTSTAYVMPNLVPPIVAPSQAIAYRAELMRLAPNTTFLMTMYLCDAITPDVVRRAAEMGVVGIKMYPRGATTHSDAGVDDVREYYAVFREMEACGLVLNLHGEVVGGGATVFDAEERFLPVLADIHHAFPRLRIVLEHATTRAAVDMVKTLGETVGCTITVHHLALTSADWCGDGRAAATDAPVVRNPHHFCKPVAKTAQDREALREVILSGHPRFFLGSDSAPHPRSKKDGASPAAGVFSSANLLPVLAHVLESFNALDRLADFGCHFGRAFYDLPREGRQMKLMRESWTVPEEFVYATEDGESESLVPFLAGEEVHWKIMI